MVNIALSAEDDLVAEARAYAQTRNTTLNQLIRDYLGRLTGRIDPQQAAAEILPACPQPCRTFRRRVRVQSPRGPSAAAFAATPGLRRLAAISGRLRLPDTPE